MSSQMMIPHQWTDISIDLKNGDALELLDRIDNDSIHLAVADPPYFIDGLDSDWKKGESKPTKSTVINGLPIGMRFDSKQGRNLQAFIQDVAVKLMRVLMPGAFVCMFSQPRLTHRMAVGLEDAGFEIRDLYVWRFHNKAQYKAFTMDHFIDKMDLSVIESKQLKESMKNRRTPQLSPKFESIILAQKPKEGTHIENWIAYETGLFDASQSLDGFVPSTIMDVDKPTKDDFNKHLTVKPIKLIDHLIRLFSVKGQMVLDPFIGSGTTALACLGAGRSCIGIEINGEYIDIAKQRLKEYGYDIHD